MKLLCALVVAVTCAASVLSLTSAHATAPVAKLIFGMGDEISGAEATPLYNAAPIDMVTSWYDNEGDLGWMEGYRNTDQVEQIYAQGKANELVVDLSSDPSYALSSTFQSDIATLTSIFMGNGPVYGPLYIVLFTEFDTYEPADNATYVPELMAAYVKSVGAIHRVDPRAYVALGLGGYNWSGSPTATADLTPETTALDDSQFVAVQAMQSCTDETLLENEVHASIAQLSSFHKPIMISYMNLWGTSVSCQTAALHRFELHILTDSTLNTLTSEGLFAFSFMNAPDVDTDPSSAFSRAVAVVKLHSIGSDVSLPT